MAPLTLSQRLFLATGVALLPAFAILYSSILISKAENEKEVHFQAARTSELVALEMERVITGAENVLRAMAVTPIVRKGDLAACSSLVSEMADAVPSLSAIAVVNPDGHFRCGATKVRPLPFVGDEAYFIEAMKSSDRVVGSFTPGQPTDSPVLPIALRIGGTEGAPPGVAVAYIDLDWLEKRLQERSYVPKSSLTIADRNGTILARVPEPERFVGTVIPEAFQYLLTMPAPGTLELTSQDGTQRVVGYVPVSARPLGLYVSAGFATETAFASTRAMTSRGVLIAVAGILAAFLLATYTSRLFVVRPVQKLVNTVQAWRDGKTGARTGLGAKDGELGDAGRAFDEFIEELLAARVARQRSEKLRQMLLAELDHRARNLLTMIQAVARQTFSRKADEPEMQDFSARLRAMGDANSMLRQDHWRSASLSLLVKSTLAPFVDMKSGRVSLSGPEVFLQSDVVLPFSMSVHELCTNAVKYGALSNLSGTVSIHWTVTAKEAGETLEFVWQERGGPPVGVRARKGFGSTVLEQVLPSHTGGEVDVVYDPAGLVCRVTILAENALVNERASLLDPA